jgi:hypothetical protein
LPDVDSEGLVVPAACDLVVEARVVDVYKLDEVEFLFFLSCGGVGGNEPPFFFLLQRGAAR